MKILHISTRLILGGSQENTVLSCEGQARLGHEVHLTFGPIYGPEGSLLQRVEEFNRSGASAHPIRCHTVPHLLRQIGPRADRLALAELHRLVLDIKPDVVHTHSSKAGILGRAAAWKVHVQAPYGHQPPIHHPGPHTLNADGGKGPIIDGTHPDVDAPTPCLPAVVHTIHGPPFMPVDGGPLHRAKVRLSNWVYARAERYAARRCHIIVSVADAMTREFLRRSIGRPEQYVTVRSGMEIAPFLNTAPGESREEVRAALGIAPGAFVVGTVARLAEHKGHDDLLEAFKNLDDPRITLLWIGDGWWKDRLIQRALNLHYSVRAETLRPVPIHMVHTMGGVSTHNRPKLLLTGLVPPERIPGLIRAMDVLAHPSYREGLPRTVPQSLLCGVCPVAYDVDGAGEICRDMQTGRLVPAGDIAALRDAITWLRDHPAERAAMAARGRAECVDAFSAERMVSELEKVYDSAIRLARGS